MDLSGNEIEKITDLSFRRYSDLIYLNLSRNDIYSIDPRTFHDSLTNLEILDLSMNQIDVLPFFPKTLKELYLEGLRLLFKDKKGLSLKEQKSLRFLSLKNDKLSAFPKLEGIGTTLEELNLQGNSFSTFSINDLAPLCKLKRLYVTREKLFQKKEELCSCLLVRRWIQEYDIAVDNFTCREESKSFFISPFIQRFSQGVESCSEI